VTLRGSFFYQKTEIPGSHNDVKTTIDLLQNETRPPIVIREGDENPVPQLTTTGALEGRSGQSPVIPWHPTLDSTSQRPEPTRIRRRLLTSLALERGNHGPDPTRQANKAPRSLPGLNSNHASHPPGWALAAIRSGVARAPAVRLL
jgi:hypothetical protein